jgi:hypothetical protein
MAVVADWYEAKSDSYEPQQFQVLKRSMGGAHSHELSKYGTKEAAEKVAAFLNDMREHEVR